MGPESIPLRLQTKSMFACNTASLAFVFFEEDEDDAGDSEGVNAMVLDVGPSACIYIITLHNIKPIVTRNVQLINVKTINNKK